MKHFSIIPGAHRPIVPKGIPDSPLIFLAVGAFGLAYGVQAVDIGFPIWLAILSSMVILSGAARFTIIGRIPGDHVTRLITGS